jgi:cytoskeleton protein RodZ
MDRHETLGGYLRALREERQGTLADMSLATRVSVGHLEALEADRLAELPASVFVKGFIRAYCHFLSQPSDEALGRYRAVLGPDRPLERALPPARPTISSSASPIRVSLALLIVLGAGLLALKIGFKPPSAPPLVTMTPVVTVESALKLGPAIKTGRTGEPGQVNKTQRTGTPELVNDTERTGEPGQANKTEQTGTPELATKMEQTGKPEVATRTEQTGQPGPPGRVEPAAARATVPASPVAASAAGQRLSVKAIELTWLRIQADDGAAAEALLAPGATREWTAEKRFLLSVGNAGGVELLLNGRPVPPLGAKGAVIRGLELPQPAAPAGS